MQIRCPHCQNGVEVIEEIDLTSISCGSCGSYFNLVGEDDIATLQDSGFIEKQVDDISGKIGHFDLLEEVGSGAFGTVWRARDTELDRIVAIKIPRHRQDSAQDREQFLREARSVAQLSHPNIVRVFEIGRNGKMVYIVSDFIDGVAIADALLTKQYSAREAAKLCIKVANALHHAHEQGVIHRDLKPANIMLDQQGEPQVMDFGLAKRDAGEITMTIDGALLGTPAYMPPEQARGEGHHVDRRADVYSLGVILYEMLTRERPFRGSIRMLIEQVIHDDAPALRKLNSSIPRDLETVVLKCLEKDPKSRYDDFAVFVSDLQAWLDHKPISARPIGAIGKFTRWCKRKPVVAAMSASILIVLTMGVFVSSYFAMDATNEARIARAATRAEAFQRQLAITESTRARQSEAAAKERERQAFRQAYVSDMLLIQRDWDVANVAHVKQLLARHKDSISIKSFEWGYWKRKISRERETLRGHVGSVTAIAVSPDGTRIASSGWDKTVKVWDAQSGKVLLSFLAHLDRVQGVIYSPDGKWIASCGLDKTVKIWDSTTGENVDILQGHLESVSCIAFSPDGSRLASGSLDRTIKIWDVDSGKELFNLVEHKAYVSSVGFSPDGKLLASGSNDATIKIWDVVTGQEQRTLHGHSRGISSVTFGPNGHWFASGSYDNTVKLWSAKTFTEILPPTPHLDAVQCIAFSPDGKWFASGSSDRTLRIWSMKENRQIMILKGHFDLVTSIVFGPDSKKIVSGSFDGTIKTWDIEVGSSLPNSADTSDIIFSVAFSSNEKRIAVGGVNVFRLWNVELGEEIFQEQDRTSTIRSVVFSPDGTKVAAAKIDGSIIIRDGMRGHLVNTITAHRGACMSIAFSPDGKRIASCGIDNMVKLWNAKSGEELLSFSGQAGFLATVIFSPDGKWIMSGGINGVLKIYDSSSGEELFELEHHGAISSARFSPDGKYIACGGVEKIVTMWNVETKNKLFELNGHLSKISCLRFSPDGRRLATASYDQTIKLWDVETAQELLTLKGHATPVTSVSFNPSGDQLISGSHKIVKLWNARSAK